MTPFASLGHQLRSRLVPMQGRDRAEPHRTASTLELFLDLVFVVAFAQASSALAHAVAEGHIRDGLVGFLIAMFAIGWAWTNFTWFASSFDTDDWLYRIMTLVQMIGVLIVALGINDLFDSIHHGHHLEMTQMTLG